MPKFERKTQKVWKGGQSWHYESLATLRKSKIRVRIKRNAYDFQSYGIAEFFSQSEGKWNKIASIPFPQLACLKVSYVDEKVTIKDFLDDEKTLWDEVAMIVD